MNTCKQGECVFCITKCCLFCERIQMCEEICSRILRKEIKLNTRNECTNFEETGGDNNENVVI